MHNKKKIFSKVAIVLTSVIATVFLCLVIINFAGGEKKWCDKLIVYIRSEIPSFSEIWD